MARGGKRRGAGRKPASKDSKKSAYYNTRMPADLKAILVTAANNNERSLAHEIEERLKYTVREDAEALPDRESYGLTSLVMEIAKFANANARAHWRHNRFAFEVLRAAIQEMLAVLSRHVPAEPTTPSEEFIDDHFPLPAVKKAIETGENLAAVFGPAGLPPMLNSEALGRYVATLMWIQARRERPAAVSLMTPQHRAKLPTIREYLSVPDILTSQEILDARAAAGWDFVAARK